MQELHIPAGRKIALHRPCSIFPVSRCQPFYFTMLCNMHLLYFSSVQSICLQFKSQSLSTFKFHSLSPAHSSSRFSPSPSLFWSSPNSSRSLYNIYFLPLEHSLFSSFVFYLPVHNSLLLHLTRDAKFLPYQTHQISSLASLCSSTRPSLFIPHPIFPSCKLSFLLHFASVTFAILFRTNTDEAERH